MGTFIFLRLIQSAKAIFPTPFLGPLLFFFLLELLLLALSNPLDFRPSVRQAARSGRAHQAGETTKQRHLFGTRERERKEALGHAGHALHPAGPCRGSGCPAPTREAPALLEMGGQGVPAVGSWVLCAVTETGQP